MNEVKMKTMTCPAARTSWRIRWYVDEHGPHHPISWSVERRLRAVAASRASLEARAVTASIVSDTGDDETDALVASAATTWRWSSAASLIVNRMRA